MTTAATTSSDFNTRTTEDLPKEQLPHAAGRRLWLPMFLVALVGFGVGVVLGFFRADAVNSGDVQAAAALGQFVPGFMFLGFLSVFAAIAFAIARILGVFRAGGAGLQKLAGVDIRTLKMPATARAFIVLMATGMMTLLVAVVLHFIVGGAIAADDASALANAETWSIVLEGVRRLGIAIYLFSIAFGLATIITVLRFQSVRIGEVVSSR